MGYFLIGILIFALYVRIRAHLVVIVENQKVIAEGIDTIIYMLKKGEKDEQRN